ncbi:MAG: TonB-dependent receptor [Raineya sp.]|nr:TonB-dependent receptor [Raineya sp.]
MNLLLCFLFVLSVSSVLAQRDSLRPATHEVEVEDLLKRKGEIDEFEDIAIITTSRTNEQKSSKAPGTIVVITAEQIQRRGYTSLMELLQDIPNVRVDNLVDPRWNNNILIRGIVGANGSANDKFILLIDGVRANSPTNDIIPIVENYPVHLAKQVEIVFGPASALYGADAFAGVINIITKTADDIRRSEVTAIGGMYGYAFGNLQMGRRINEDLSYTFSAQYHYDKQPQLSKFYPEEYKNLEQNLQSGTFNTIFGPQTANVSPYYSQTPLQSYAMHGNVRYKNLSFTLFRNEAINPSTIAQTPDNVVYNRGAFFGHNVTMGNLIFQKNINKWQLTSFLIGSHYWLNPESNFRNVYSGLRPAYKFSNGLMLKAEQLASYTLNSVINFSGGITYEYFNSVPRGHDLEYALSNRKQRAVIIGSIYPLNPAGIEVPIPFIEYSNIGGFLQTQITPIEKLAITLGSRYDVNSRYGASLNPRAGIVFEINKYLNTKLLYGSAFLAPSPLFAFEQFGSFVSFDNGANYVSFFFRLPNPDLKPQTIQTFESSTSFNNGKNFRANFNAFYSISEGLFNYGPDFLNGNRYNGQFLGYPVNFIEVAINSERQFSYGGSLDLEYRWNISNNQRLNTYASVSYVNGKVTSKDNSNQEILINLAGISPWIVKTGFELELSRLTFSPRLIWLNEQYTYAVSQRENGTVRQKISGYALLNLHLNYRVSNYFNVFLQGRNLLDQRYYSLNLGASPETAIQGAAGAEFGNGAPQNPLRLMAGLNVKF